jgi:trimeric autotransporter adhesin
MTNTNLVVWEKPITTSIDRFHVYRETSQAGLYQFVGSVLYSDESIYNDLVASPNVRSWRYKITSVDACGNESAQSDNHKTIHLVVNQGLGNDINLSWDSYEGFPYTQFQIRRKTNLDGWNLIQTMPSNLFSFTDSNVPTTDGLIYTVTVAAPGTCTSTKSAQDFNTTRSNRDNRLSTGNSTNGLAALLDATIAVYPNPATDQVVINNSSSYAITGVFMDASGRVLMQVRLLPGEQTVDVSQLASGIYQFELNLDGIRTTKWIVISK